MPSKKILKKTTVAVEASIYTKLNILKKYNIYVGAKKTSVTLEPLTWELLHSIAEIQKWPIHDLCSFIHERKHPDASLASAIRVFIMAYQNIQIKQKDNL